MEKENFANEIFEGFYEREIYAIPEPEKIAFISLGNESELLNARMIFIVKNPDHPFFSNEEKAVLEKTADWKELNLKREEVKVINVAHQPVFFALVNETFHSPSIVVFGVEPSELGLRMEKHSNQKNNFCGVNLIFTSSILELMKNEILKKKFFEALKSIYK